jgi:hypothetical protein
VNDIVEYRFIYGGQLSPACGSKCSDGMLLIESFEMNRNLYKNADLPLWIFKSTAMDECDEGVCNE